MPLMTSAYPGHPTAEEQNRTASEGAFNPVMDAKALRNAIKKYKAHPDWYSEEDKENLRQHAAYYNIPFYEGEFDLIDAIKQAGAGFFEGFTTFNLMEPADNEYEQIFRNLGHLAGFAPGLIATPLNLGAKLTKSVALSNLAKTAAALNDKSIPMAGAKILTKKAKEIVKPALNMATTGRAGAASDAFGFLTGNKARHIMEGAFHLGSASAISSWQGGVDEMMHSFIGGASAGAVFRAIGNLPLDTITGSEKSQKVLRGMAGSLFMGLPSTMRGATTPEQVYEYVMGAYFGKSERPWTQAKAQKFIKKVRERSKTDENLRESMDPELHPEFPDLPPEVKPMVKKMAEDLWMKPEDRLLMNSLLGKAVNPEKLEAIPAEIEGYEIDPLARAEGEIRYKPKKGFLSKFVTRIVSGGAEGADRAWAKAGDDLGIPVINFTFRKHEPQAMLNKGHTRKLTQEQLESANAEITQSSISLDRPLGNMKEYTLNLLRRNWFQVRNSDAVYAVAPIIRKGDKAMRVVDGGTGWAVDMGIRHGKDVYVFDNSNKAQHAGAITNQWYKYDMGLGVFQPIKGTPPKPPKTWAGIGSREISKAGENAINTFVNKHFKGKKITASPEDMEAARFARKTGQVVLEDAVKVTDNRIKDLEEAIELGELDIAAIKRGEEIVGRKLETSDLPQLEKDVTELYKELEMVESERKYYLDSKHAGVHNMVNLETGEITQVKKGEHFDFPDNNAASDTGPGAKMYPTKTAVQFVQDHLKPIYDTKLDFRAEEANLASRIVEEVSKFGTGTSENKSEALAESIIKYAKDVGKTDIVLNKEARGTLRKWLSKHNFDKQIFHYGTNGHKVYPLIRPEELGTRNPFTGSGVSKANVEPVKILQEAWEKAGGKPEDIPVAILDHVTITDKKGRSIDLDFVRYEEHLENQYRFKDYSIDAARKAAKRDFTEFKARVYSEMNKNDFYYYGGRGDKDRMYFVKFHPGVKLAESSQEFLKTVRAPLSKGYKELGKRFVKQYKKQADFTESSAAELFNKSFLSNIIYDMQMNGFKVGTASELAASAKLMFSGKGDFISSSKAFNKRSAIWLNNGYPGDITYLKEFKAEDGGKIKLTNDKFNYILVEDLPKEIRDKMDKDPLYASNILRKSTELGEHVDGSILAESRSLQGINADAGSAEYNAQNKSYIVSPDASRGALLGKYMMHSAGETLSKFMRDNNINFIVHGTAAKQRGLRNIGRYSVNEKGLDIHNSEIYQLDPSHIKYNYEVISDSRMTKWSRAVKQLLGSLLDNTSVPFKKDTINDMLNTLLNERFEGDPEVGKEYDTFITKDLAGQKASIPSLMNKIDKLSIKKILEGIRRPNNEIFAENAYNYMLTKSKEILETDYRSGELTSSEYDSAISEIRAEDQIYRKKLAAARLYHRQNKSDEAKVNGIMYDKDVRKYRESVIKNYVIREASKPLIKNSGIARMRPYDKAMQINLDKANKRLKELDTDDTVFFLDNGYKNMMIDTGYKGIGKKGMIRLEDLWNNRKSKEYENIDVNEIFNALVLRVPMDSPSGAHVLRFRGFTGREGYGTLLHSRVMRALGGADLDGDDAHFYFGGEKTAFKKAWKDGFKANKEEFYYEKNGKTYVGDNKTSIIPSNVRKLLKLPKLNKDGEPYTYRDWLTQNEQFTKQERDLLNSRGAMYTILERDRISEAASRGRAQMGSSAVVPKQMMQQLHSMLGGGAEGEKILTDRFTIERKNWNKAKKKYETIKYELVVSPKTQPHWRKLASEIGRAQVAFSSDPMDEIGLRSKNMWFKALHNAYFNVQILKNGKRANETDLGYRDLTSWDLNKGLYGTINNLNRAYWGRNYREGRKFTMDEIKALGRPVYGLRSEQRNNFLVKVAEKLQPLDWTDNVIGRVNKDYVLDMYKEINQAAANPKWKFLMKLMGRSSFQTPESKHLLQAIWAKDRNGHLLRLYDAESRRAIAKNTHLFQDAIDINTVNTPKGIRIKQSDLDAAFRGRSEQYVPIREKILNEIAYKAEDFFINDLNDMATFKLITKLADKMNSAELSRIPLIHKFVEDIKSRSYLMAKTRSQIANFDWARLDKDSADMMRAYMKDADVGHLAPDYLKGTNDKKSSSLDRAEIDRRIVEFRNTEVLTENEAQMMDYLLLGTYRRGNLSKINKLEAELAGADPVIRDMIGYLKTLAAGTSMSRIGYNSEALHKEQSLVDMIGTVSDFVNETWKRPSTESVEKAQDVAVKMKETLKKETEIDLLEDDVISDIELTTGYEGLKKGVEYTDVPSELRSKVIELQNNVLGENNKFKQNFNEVVRSLLGKNLNILNKEDYDVLNNWFRETKKGTIWQQIWGKKGPTELAKRHHWLFPKTINRELMRDDIELMEEKGFYVAKGGNWLTAPRA